MAHEYHEDVKWNRSPTNVHDEDNDFCRNIIATKLSDPEFRRKPIVNRYASPYARKKDEDDDDVLAKEQDGVNNGEVNVVSEDEALHWDFRSCFKTLFVPDKVSGDGGPAEGADTNAEQDEGRSEVANAEGGIPVPIEEQEKQPTASNEMAFSPDKNLDQLLSTERLDYNDDDQVSQKYLKVKSKYVTDGQGVVSGVLLVTPQTVMFNPCVSDHLVMERGRDIYVVRLPLRAIARIALFEDVAAMVSGDLSKQYIPKESFIDYASEHLLSPKPGMIVRQPTGELYVLPDSNIDETNENKNSLNKEKDKELLASTNTLPQTTTRSRCDTSTTESNTTIDVSDSGIGSCIEPLSRDDIKEDISLISPTATTSLGEGGDGCAGCGNYREFMEDGLSSTPKHRRYSTSSVDTAGTLCGGDVLTDTVDEGGGGANLGFVRESAGCAKLDRRKSGSVGVEDVKDCAGDTRGSIEGDGGKVDLTNNDASCTQDFIAETLVENHFDVTIPGKGDSTGKETPSHQCVNSSTGESTETKFGYIEYGDGTQGNDSKDSGISELSSSANLIEGNELKEVPLLSPPTPAPLSSSVPPPAAPLRAPLARGSSLSDEARQWLGKRGVRLSLDQGGVVHYMADHRERVIDRSDSSERSMVGRVDDPLMYMSIKVIKSYWCPIRHHHNQIMGVPLNRDQKRREHWFAMPRERVDQFYNFLHYWSPDVYAEDSSGFSTPCSSECENFEEKAKGVDVPGMKIHRSWSLYSVSSSTRSLAEDEIPDLQAESQILTRKQVHLLTRKLPSRTVGHSWELIYSTTIHGISLSTLYRNFHGYDTPVLIVVKDENQKVFGAFMSEVPKISEGFYGTGESMLYTFMTETSLKLYNWTGDNNFFIKGSKSSLVIGGGEGMFGLWLDEDLYRGRSHACRTFANETLSTSEDFICCGLEAWGFV